MGYLIVPKLFSGEYPVTIDFPKNIYPSQQFDLNLNHQDLGFILKKMDSNGWVLQNLQDNQLISSKYKDSEQDVASNKEVDDFTKTLSQITNTPLPEEKKTTLIEKTTDHRMEMPVDSVQTSLITEEQKLDSTKVIVQNISSLADTIQVSSVNEVKIERSDVSLFFSTTDSSGQSLIYIVGQSDALDTVVVFIPAENNSIIASPVNVTVKEVVVEEKAAALTTVDAVAGNTEKNIPVNKCDKVAGEKDFLQLRKKMASQDKEKDMLLQAEKAFQSKCFSTQQVRNLSGLFLEEDKKLDFLLMSRTKLTDSENFGSLISLLAEDSNIKKFIEIIQ